MPTYEYFCSQCDKGFEAVQRFSDAPLSQCPAGHEGVRRIISPAGIIFKGSGWYIKDSKSAANTAVPSASGKGEKGEKGEAKAEASGDSPSEPKSEPKSEAKGETKGEAKSEAA